VHSTLWVGEAVGGTGLVSSAASFEDLLMDRGPRSPTLLLEEDSMETKLDRGNFVGAVSVRSFRKTKGRDNSTLSMSEWTLCTSV
jgi:hypothetical protein